MRYVAVSILMLAVLAAAPATAQEDQPLTAADVPGFLTQMEKDMAPVEAAFDQLADENLPLYDESGQALGRRHIENRRKELEELRGILAKLRDEPDNLVLVAQLYFQIELLTDDVYDLSQIAYDNDREDLGRRLGDMVGPLDDDRGRVETYTLQLAQDKESRLKRLEQENQDLKQQLAAASKAKTPQQ